MKRNRFFAILFLMAGMALNLSAQKIDTGNNHTDDYYGVAQLIYEFCGDTQYNAKLSDVDNQKNQTFEPFEGLYFHVCEPMEFFMRFSNMTSKGVGMYYPYYRINVSLVSQDLNFSEPLNLCMKVVSIDSLSSFSQNDSLFLLPGDYKLRLSVEGVDLSLTKDSSAVALSSGTNILVPIISQHTLSVDFCSRKLISPEEKYPAIPRPDAYPLHSLRAFPKKNMVNVFKSRDGSASDGSLSISYYDDIGRLDQAVRQKFTPQMKDLVTWQEYDSWGRKSNTWLPVPVMQDSGMYVLSEVYKKQALKTYEGDTRTYTSYKYEASPLEKVVEQCGPGHVWHEHGRMVRTTEFTNVAGDDTLDCYSFQFVEGAGEALSILAGRNYSDGSLFVVRTEDEGGKIAFEFKDKSDKVVLLRQAESATGGKQVLDTYYVYDDLGQLRAVLPPALSGHISVGAVEPRLLEQYAYLYKYDAAGNLSAKKLPGIDWTYYVYDRNSRMIFSQTGVEREKGECEFYISDSFGRVCLQGVCRNAIHPFNGEYLDSRIFCRYSGMPEFAGYLLIRNEGLTKPAFDYSLKYNGWNEDLTKLVLDQPEIRMVNYYDHYDFLNKAPFGSDSLLSYVTRTGFDVHQAIPKGLLTGTLTLCLSASDEPSQPVCQRSVVYYDEHGRKIQTVSDHHLSGTERDCYRYNSVTGSPINHLHEHTSASNPVLSELYTYTYDSGERLAGVSHKLNNKPEVLLSGNEYNELGQLCTQSLHNGLLHTAYEYNVRGWLSQIENPLFHQNLHYTDGVGVPCYDGNISSMTWATDSSDLRGYRFFYDGFSRLTDAVYGEGRFLNENPNRFSERVTAYDKMGNILALIRYGQTGSSTYGLIDDLSLSYNGNQLRAVNDNSINSVYADGFEFKDGAKLDTEYVYDANGNLVKDLDKKITNIQYNYLNLPNRIEFEDGSSISYLYDAAGTKLRVVHSIAGNITTTDYCGNVIYENGIPKTLLTDGGFVSLSDGKYHYYLQDHQGNNRVVVSQDGTVEELNHYYPFGGIFASTSSVQPYKYNGKELDRKGGLDWYDYGARHYDAALGRWNAVDPMAEKYYGISPYNYCANNPVKNIDPDGRTIVIWYNNNRSSYMYSGGNVAHPNAFVRSVVTAYQYNKANGIKAGNGGGASTVAIVENTDIKVSVMEAIYEDAYNPYASRGTIYWNSEWGSQNDNGTVRSPATIFDHEADHALEHKTNPEAYEVNRVKDSDLQYDTKEERRVITGSEQKTARANGDTCPGQVTRRNHHGRTVITKGVTSNIIDKQKTQVYEKRKKPIWTSELEQ